MGRRPIVTLHAAAAAAAATTTVCVRVKARDVCVGDAYCVQAMRSPPAIRPLARPPARPPSARPPSCLCACERDVFE